jgi:prepilin-type N-terminal cleavage/methylation domain-containing protein
MISQSSKFDGRVSRAAFTLVEILLAVAILGMVITAVYATWSAGLAGWKRSSSVSESLQRERVVLDTLMDLTSSLVYFGSKDRIYAVQGLHDMAKGDSISFVTGSDALLPATEILAAGMRRVTIAMGHDEAGRNLLGMVNQSALGTEANNEELQQRVLCMDVTGFGVRYRDPRNGVWQEKWEEDGVLPSAVEYTVAFGGADPRTPPIVVTRAIEIPAAEFAMQSRGQTVGQQGSSTNGVRQREVGVQGGGTVGGTSAGNGGGRSSGTHGGHKKK